MKEKYKKPETPISGSKITEKDKKIIENSLLKIPKMFENEEKNEIDDDKIEIGMEEDEFQILKNKNKNKKSYNIDVRISEIGTDGTVNTNLTSSEGYPTPTTSFSTSSSSVPTSCSPTKNMTTVDTDSGKEREQSREQGREQGRDIDDLDNDNKERMERTDSNEDLSFSLPCQLTSASDINHENNHENNHEKNHEKNHENNHENNLGNCSPTFSSSAVSSPLHYGIGGWGDVHHETVFPDMDEKPIFTANPMRQKKKMIDQKSEKSNYENENENENDSFNIGEKTFSTENPLKGLSLGKKRKSLIVQSQVEEKDEKVGK